MRLTTTFAAWCLCAVGATAAVGVAAPPATAPSAPAAKPAADLPDADTLFKEARVAMGGEAAFKKIKSSKMSLTMNTPMGAMETMLASAQPDKYLVRREVPGMGTFDIGLNGTIGWASNPMQGGYQLLPKEAHAEVADQAVMYDMVGQFRRQFPEASTVDKVEFGGDSCWKVKMTNADGETQHVYFDVSSHLPAGAEQTESGPAGPVTSTVRFGDWREVGEVRVPHLMSVQQGPMAMDITVNEVSFNDVDEAMFAIPDEVKALAADAEKKPETPGTAPDGN